MLFHPFRNEFFIEAFCARHALLCAAESGGDQARSNPSPTTIPAPTTYRP